MPNWLTKNNYILAPRIGNHSLATLGTVALNTLYVTNTSGAAVGWRIPCPPSAATLTDVYIYCSAIAGTAGSINVKFDVKNMTATATPGTTIHGSETFNGAFSTAARWYRFTFTTPITVPNPGVIAVVMGNVSAAPTTNIPTIQYSGPLSTHPDQIERAMFHATNGLGAASSAVAVANVCFVAKFSDGSLVGNSYTTALSDASNQLERGIYLPAMDSDLVVDRISFNPTASYTNFRIIKDTTIPGATVGVGEMTTSLNTQAMDAIGVCSFTPFTLLAGQAYRAVFQFSANTTLPGYYVVGDNSRYADVDTCTGLDAERGPQRTFDNGAGGWTTWPGQIPRLTLYGAAWPASKPYYVPSLNGGFQ